MKIKQGDTLQMLSNGNHPVRQFLVLETEVCESALNALLYETSLNGKEAEKDSLGIAALDWWDIRDHANIVWKRV